MARKPKGYWEQRNTEMMLNYEKQTEKQINKLITAYNKAQQNIEKEIKNIYKNYAKDGVLNEKTLKKLLNKKESEEYYNKLLEEINTVKDGDYKKVLLAKYNAPAYAYRISRYEQLKANVDVELKKLADIEKRISTKHYENIVEDGYYRTIYEIQKGIGKGFGFAQIDTTMVKSILAENWQGSNFSSRIWGNSERLIGYMNNNFLGDYLSGKSLLQASKGLANAMNIGLFQATRLMRTETNHFANESEMMAYEELEIEKYMFVATLDNITCEHCSSLDNKIFNIQERKAGVNYPPLHPNDRCTTIAVLDEIAMLKMDRRARDVMTNENYIINNNTSYEKWKNEMDSRYGENTVDLAHKKHMNLAQDKEQYKRYRKILGKNNMPISIEKWQDLKYNNIEKYEQLKYEVALKEHYNIAIKKGDLSPLVDFNTYQDVDKSIKNELVGLNTINDISIKSYSKHFIDRVCGSVEQKRTGVEIADIKETLLNSTNYKNVKESIVFIGRNNSVSINPKTGNLIQTNPISERRGKNEINRKTD